MDKFAILFGKYYKWRMRDIKSNRISDVVTLQRNNGYGQRSDSFYI